MTKPTSLLNAHAACWQWPITLDEYDRTPHLSDTELKELDAITHHPKADYLVCCKRVRRVLDRLVRPLNDALDVTKAPESTRGLILNDLLWEMLRRRTTFWAWSAEDWSEIIGSSQHAFSQRHKGHNGARQHYIAISYLLGGIIDLSTITQLFWHWSQSLTRSALDTG